MLSSDIKEINEIENLKNQIKNLKRKLSNIKEHLNNSQKKWKEKEARLQNKINKLLKDNIKLTQQNSFIRHRSCGMKVTFDERIAKLKALEKGQRYYRCKFCNG